MYTIVEHANPQDVKFFRRRDGLIQYCHTVDGKVEVIGEFKEDENVNPDGPYQIMGDKLYINPYDDLCIMSIYRWKDGSLEKTHKVGSMAGDFVYEWSDFNLMFDEDFYKVYSEDSSVKYTLGSDEYDEEFLQIIVAGDVHNLRKHYSFDVKSGMVLAAYRIGNGYHIYVYKADCTGFNRLHFFKFVIEEEQTSNCYDLILDAHDMVIRRCNTEKYWKITKLPEILQPSSLLKICRDKVKELNLPTANIPQECLEQVLI